jgi:hypothetical protein
MFGWFASSCPVDSAAKQWIESRLQWLSQHFGRDVFTRRAVILPTSEFFPDPIDGSKASVHNLLGQVCRYMDADPESIDLEFITQTPDLWLVNDDGKYLPTGAAGLYDERPGRTIIHIATAEMYDLTGLVGTMAHELAHLRLMGEGRMNGDEFDNELLTDLTAVFHGFGIFLGSSPRNWDSQYGVWPGTQLRRPEYMTLPMFGYALAHSAWLRGEGNPEWARYLSFELRPCFKQGLRFLKKTGDSAIVPE